MQKKMIISASWIWIFLILHTESFSLNKHNVDGTTDPQWEFVRDLFEENFIKQRDLGASMAIYYQGKPVVDLWGGWFDRTFTKPYDNNTLQLVFSTTKGVVAIASALCVQRGLLDYSELVTEYWPEYGQYGKENTTVADILSHRAGIPSEAGFAEHMLNWTAMVYSLEKQKPLWPPGTAHSYHSLTYGWLAGELIRRVDPKKRTLGQFILDEIAKPLDIEFYIGLPIEKQNRVSPLLFSYETLEVLNNTVKDIFMYFNDPLVHRAEIPAGNGIGNARSIAKLYASLLGDLDNGKQKRLLNENVLQRAIKSNTPVGEPDYLTHAQYPFALGFMLYDGILPFSQSHTFGHSGAGGSIAFAIPSKNFSLAYVMNQLEVETPDDPIPKRFETLLQKIADKLDSLDQ